MFGFKTHQEGGFFFYFSFSVSLDYIPNPMIILGLQDAQPRPPPLFLWVHLSVSLDYIPTLMIILGLQDAQPCPPPLFLFLIINFFSLYTKNYYHNYYHPGSPGHPSESTSLGIIYHLQFH